MSAYSQWGEFFSASLRRECLGQDLKMRRTLEISMIAKNAEAGLARCLASVSGIADRILVGDTGSTDHTREIAQQHGAEVLAIPWQDDFAAARNQVLARAQCDWILVLDADEMLDPDGAAQIRDLLAASGDQPWGYDSWRWNYVRALDYRSGGEQAVANPGSLEQARDYPAYFRSNHTRLFRRDARIRFDHCVHESVVESFAAAGLSRARANFVIHHFGYVDDSPEARDQKDELYRRLAYRKLAASPGNAEAHLEAGIAELEQAKDPRTALAHLSRAISIQPGLHAAWLYRGICLTRLGRYRDSLEDLTRAFAADATNPLIHCSTADAHFQLGNYEEAQRWYMRAAAHGDRSPVSRAKLGTAEIRVGLCTQGLENVRQAVREQPASGELLDILSMAALLAGEPRVACEAVERRLALDGAAAFHFLSAAAIYKYVGEREGAGAILQRGLALFPGDPELIALALEA